MKDEKSERILSKNINHKTRECYWFKTKHPHAWLSGVSIHHPRAWHWDPWPIRKAGFWKSRNLGIGFWQSQCWHSDMPVQLFGHEWRQSVTKGKSWTNAYLYAWYVCVEIKTLAFSAALYEQLFFFLRYKYPLFIWFSKIKHKYINCHNIEIS